MKKIITMLSIKSNKINSVLVLFSFLLSFNLHAQVFWTENFNNGCVSLCPESGYAGVNGAWTMTALAGNIGATPNQWFVSCAENGHTPLVCGTGCVPASATATLASLHVGNISTSPLAAFSCPTGDCGAAYDAGLGIGGDVETDKRAESPTINCTGQVGITLGFNYIAGGQSGQDFCTVEYSDNNGATWNFLATPNVSTICGGQGLWDAFSFILPVSCDNNPTVKIGFRWVNDDDGGGADPSFAVDDVTLSAPVVGNTITTGIVNGPFCACSTINVPFSSTGVFGAGNIYKAQLSDAAGSFGAPVNIGTLVSSANAGNITCTIPCNTPPGNGYLIQVISSNPNITGSNNGVNITINAPDDSTFTYSAPSYCQAGADPTPVVGLPGGTFTSTPAGLVFLSTSTGQIDVSASTIGCYNITYTTNGPCPSSMTTPNICITGTPVANFSYTGTPYCANVANPVPTYNGGGVAGSFSATPLGLVFVGGGPAGQVDLTASTPGTYTVTNDIAASGGCPAATFSSTITINAVQSSSFTYTGTTFCQTGTNPLPNITGTAGGTFTSAPATLVFVNANTGEINLAGSPLGNYTITYTTPGPCATSSTFAITITLAPDATFTYNPTSYCQSATNPLPVFGAGASAGVFSAAPAGLTFVSTATGEIDLINSAPGTYTITNSIAASGGCSASTATFSVTIIAAPAATFSYIGSPYCTSGLNPSPTYSGGGVAGTFTATPVGLNIVPSTGAVTLNSSAVGTYTVTNTIVNAGCPNSVATATIQIIAAQVATFSYTGTPYCQNGTDPSPTFSGGGIAGNFTAAPAGLTINAVSGLVTLSSSAAGTYTVTNTIPASTSCPAVSATSTITINTAPTVTVNSGSVCAGSTFTLTANGATNYSWSAGATSTGVNTATVSPVVTTTYTVTGTTAGCSGTAVATVTISAPLPVTVNSPTICSGQTANLVAGGATTYTWSAGATSSGVNTATAAPTTTTSYTVTGTTAGCTGTAVSIVTVQICVPPVAGFGAVPLNLCSNGSGCTMFYDSSSANTTTWSWQFPGGIPSNSTSQNPGQVCYPTSPTNFSYTVILIVTNAQGDADTLIRANYITIVSPIQVSITSDKPMVNSCEPAHLTAEPAGSSYLWGSYISAIICETCQTATVNPDVNTQYWVNYTDINGCPSTDTILETVTEIYTYFMPTGIAPDGPEPNNLLVVHGRGINSINLKIFDRVGEKVFETSSWDVDKQESEGWDGRLHGLPMNENCFVYELTVTYCNNRTVEENGSLTLVK